MLDTDFPYDQPVSVVLDALTLNCLLSCECRLELRVLPVPITASQTGFLYFSDVPGMSVSTDVKQPGVVLSYQAQFLLYFMYQDSTAGAFPTLLQYPVSWGASWQAEWNDENEVFDITDRQIESLALYDNVTPPTWEAVVKAATTEDPKTINKKVGARDPHPLDLKKLKIVSGRRKKTS